MKTIIIFGVVISIVAVGLTLLGAMNGNVENSELSKDVQLLAIKESHTMGEMKSYEDLILNTSLYFNVPAEMDIYKVNYNYSSTSDIVKNIAKRIGVENNTIESEDTFEINDDNKKVEIDKKTGAIWFMDTQRIWKENNPKLPDDEKAINIAKEFLDKAGFANYVLHEVVADKIMMMDRTGEKKIAEKEKQAIFTCTLNEIPVFDGRIKVFIGNNGDVIGMYYSCRDVTPDRKVKIISPLQAFEKLKEEDVKGEVEGSAVVKRTYINYALSSDENYVLPVYVFEIEDSKAEYDEILGEKPKIYKVIPAAPESTINEKKYAMPIDNDKNISR